MILETIRMVADALASSTYGVNVQLATLPVDGTDTIAPDIATIVDETRSDEVAVGRYPTALPCLIVTQNRSLTVQGDIASDNRDGEVTILIRYITTETGTAQANTWVLYTLRAIQRALRQFNTNAHAADRNRGYIQNIECLSMEVVEVFENIDDAHITGGLKATFKVRDTLP
jgi:hypothetical protein